MAPILGVMHLYAMHSASSLRQHVWLAGWLAVCHSRYCIKTTKPILNLCQPSGSPIIKALGPLCRYQIPRVIPSSGVFNTLGVGKLAIFDGNGRYLGKGAR